jgi:hypothetical protein
VIGDVTAARWLGRSFVCVLALLLVAACERDSRVPVPLPTLPEGTIELRVVYLVNPRFPSLSGEELRVLLDAAAETVKAHFGRDVRFSMPAVEPIQTYFHQFDARMRESADASIFDFKRGKGDVARLRKGFEKDLRDSGDDLDAMIAYAQPHLLRPVRERSYAALVEALIDTQLARLEDLTHQRAADGAPVLDASPFNEVVYWDAVAYAPLPYEVVLTNQLIASVEYASNSVHSALRGGITNGLTTPNPASRYKTTAITSVYPFTSEDAAIRALRAGETYARRDALRFAGILLAHEIGHQLWHLGHPYGRTACVMNPTPLLHFRQWAEALAPAQCPFAGDGPMKPGFTRIYSTKLD